MADEPRDKWSKLEVLSKAVAGLLLAIILLILGNLYTSQQQKDNEAKRSQEKAGHDPALLEAARRNLQDHFVTKQGATHCTYGTTSIWRVEQNHSVYSRDTVTNAQTI